MSARSAKPSQSTAANRGIGVSARGLRWVLLALPLTLFGHYAWELGQAQLFADHAGTPLSSYALHCFVAALGDVVIASSAYAIAAVAFRRVSWPIAQRALWPAVTWVAAGSSVA